MKLNIVIVNYNSGEYLRNCIASIKAMDGTVRDYDITVFDNASSDTSMEDIPLIKGSLHILKANDNHGFAYAVNRILQRTDGEYVLLVNPDVVIFPGTINAMVTFMDRHPRAGAVGAEILNPAGYRQPTCRAFPRYFNVLFGRRSIARRLFPNNPWTRRYLFQSIDHYQPQQVDFVEGSVMLLRRTALEKIGFFDEDFFLYLEDADLCYRLQKEHWETWWLPQAYAIHYRGETFRRDNIHPAMHHSKGFALFFNKHYHPSAVMKFVLKVLLTLRLGYVVTTESLKKVFHDSNFSPRK